MGDHKGCSIRHTVEYGIDVVYLENELLKVTILVGKGSEIFEIIYKKLDMDILLKTKNGLSAYKERNLHEQRLTWYSELYTGGWQDVLPHRGIYEDIEVTPDMYGIAATLPWDYELLELSSEIVRIKCVVKLPVVPLYIEKTFCLRSNDPTIYIDETVENTGASEMKFTWTQHSAFGGQFLDEHVEIVLPDCVAFHARKFAAENQADLAQFEEAVDAISLVNGSKHNLLKVSPRFANEELFITLKNVSQPEVTLINRKKKVAVRLCWDMDSFPYLRYWYKNNDDLYTVAIEPSNDYFTNWEHSLAHGTYLTIQPREKHTVWLACKIYDVNE
ncbi:DUF4432 family protein [Paenibacillus sp. 1_12]|uniref:DUF4432 family protein n=1 Tax=Paenibacillus sp. 1_12 TaxID=1566278 RepID=UPI0015A5864B|nr:DUF4432 family protein [Paenibacillus sp. 1_12]